MSLDITGINITGRSNLFFSGYFAEDDDTAESWDSTDYVRISYQIDGGGYQPLMWFENNGGFVSAPFADLDFDGAGEGTQITNSFTQLTTAIAGTGSTLDLRVTFNLNDSGEDFAFDNFLITTEAIPEPGAGLFLALLTVAALHRRRKSRYPLR